MTRGNDRASRIDAAGEGERKDKKGEFSWFEVSHGAPSLLLKKLLTRVAVKHWGSGGKMGIMGDETRCDNFQNKNFDSAPGKAMVKVSETNAKSAKSAVRWLSREESLGNHVGVGGSHKYGG